jgi:sortase A
MAAERRHTRFASWPWHALQVLMLGVAVILLGSWSYAQLATHFYQEAANRELDRLLIPVSADGGVQPALFTRPRLGETFGRISISALGMSSVIVAGSDARSLARAVGFIPGTALPGEGGNTGLAAHRDTFFRRLEDIRINDVVTVNTAAGTFEYLVENTQIVDPEDVWVLDPTTHPTITLVTCYPFNFVGTAPQRFIVRAALRQKIG